jgi:saccharopine dehydrogenase-like NADP-dependent oxidoreductase
MSKFLKGIKGNEKKEVTSYDADAIAEKLHSVGAPATIAAVEMPIVAVAQTETAPKAVAKKKSTRVIIAEEDKEELHRLTLDIPKDIMDQMRKDTKRRGQTIKGFIVSLIYDFYEKPQ